MPQLLSVIGPRGGNAPLTYTVTEPGTVDLQSIFARFDGSGAGGSFKPVVTIRAQNGAILARVFPSQDLAAGDTADVTFAPFLRDSAGSIAWSTDGLDCAGDPVVADSGTLRGLVVGNYLTVTDLGGGSIRIDACAGAPTPATPTLIGTSTTTASSLGIPAHVAGDLILMYAYKNAATTVLPVAPGGWTNIFRNGSDNWNAQGLWWRIATGSGTASGTWTNTTALEAIVYRNASAPTNYDYLFAQHSATLVSFPALTLDTLDGTSRLLGVVGTGSAADAGSALMGTPPAGMVNLDNTAGGAVGVHETPGGLTTNWPLSTVGMGATTGYRCAVVEIPYDPS